MIWVFEGLNQLLTEFHHCLPYPELLNPIISMAHNPMIFPPPILIMYNSHVIFRLSFHIHFTFHSIY